MIIPNLRPLGIGEILDRAVSLYVRRFAVLVLILAIVAVPVAIVQYASAPASSAMIADVQRILSVPPGHADERRAILNELQSKNRLSSVAAAVLVLSIVLAALSSTAFCIGVAQAYSGRLPSVREVYREALRRWLAQLAAGITFFALAFVLAIGFTIVVVFVSLAIFTLRAASPAGALVAGIPLGIVALLVFIGAIIWLYLAAQLSFVSIALEEPNPIRGIASGLRRTFSRALIWRSLLVGAILFAVSLIGGLVLLSVGAAASVLTHVSALYPVITVVGGVALNGLVITFVVVYAFDVRVRREGYDLAQAVETVPL